MPRITTTVLNNGRVLHKIERSLDRAVESVEEQAKTEVIIKRQHGEVISILQGDSPLASASQPVSTVHSEPDSAPPPPVSPAVQPAKEVTPDEKLRQIPGVTHVFTLDNEGNFFSNTGSEQFAKMFAPIFRNVSELVQLFGREPGVGITREPGVVEIERDRLYFASSGTECYFIVVRRVNVTTEYEKEIKQAVRPPEL
jgi:hypothetical protein